MQILSVKASIMLKQIKSYPGRSENENEETWKEKDFIQSIENAFPFRIT